MSLRSPISNLAALAAAVLLTGCVGRNEAASPAASVRASVSLAQSGAASSAVMAQLVSELTGGRVPASYVDSLMVTVTRVDVLPDSVLAACRPPLGDSARGFHPGPPGYIGGPLGLNGPHGNAACEAWREGHRMMGPPPGAGWPPDSVTPFNRPDDPRTHEDSLLPPDTGWGSRLDQWYSLSVVGEGRIDLMHLPTDTANGLLLAADTVPAGAYGAARLIISDATLWLNTAVTTRDSVTLEANTPYAVELPHRGGQPMGIMTNAGFTVPSDGGNVVLIFDASQAFGTPIVTDSGKVVLGPMLRPRKGRS
jgi:hypothetical protein